MPPVQSGPPNARETRQLGFDINFNQKEALQNAEKSQLGRQPPANGRPVTAPSQTAKSVDVSGFVHPPENYKPEFPWKRVGAFIDENNPPEFSSLMELADSKNAFKLTRYISEKYYADLYWNCSLVIGMCFFSWLMAYWGWGLLSLIMVCMGGFTIYRLEFRRFNANIRDDMKRVHAADHLEDKLESMHWLNNFLSKFWVIYMPALSDLVIQSTNEILKTVTPPPPIVRLTLDEFTLGTKAPKVESIKSVTKLGKDIYQMDWALNFTPNNTNDMTANELKNKVAPKIALGIKIGKSFVGASLPILVEDMSFEGLLRIKLKIGDTFPHIDVVSISFLEQPKIDYALKPVGGNTFGLDVMSLIPGLSSFVNGLIHSNLAPMLYAPNSLDINVNDIVQSTMPSAKGVLAVKIRGAEYLSEGDDVINPFVQFNTEYGLPTDWQTTDTKSNTNVPIFNEVKHMLINDLQSRLHFKLNNLKSSGEDQVLCEAFFELQDLLQTPEMSMVETKLTHQSRNVGKIVYDLNWFPLLVSDEQQNQSSNNSTPAAKPQSDTGILDFTLLSARDLHSSQSLLGKLSTYAEIYLNGELIATSRLAKGTNNPEYREKLEKLVMSKASARLEILIKDISSFNETVIAKYHSGNIDDLFISEGKVHTLQFTETEEELYPKHVEQAKQEEKDDAVKAAQDEIANDDPKVDYVNGGNAVGASGGVNGTGAVSNSSKSKNGAKRSSFMFSCEWKPLPSIDTRDDVSFIPPIGVLRLHIREANDLPNLETLGTIDPYVQVISGGVLRGESSVVKNSLNPKFMEVFYLSVWGSNEHVKLRVMDVEPGDDDREVGSVGFKLDSFQDPANTNKKIRMVGKLSRNGKPTGTLSYVISYYPLMPIYSHKEVQNIKTLKERSDDTEDLADLEEQAKFLEDYKKNPDNYEWVDQEDEADALLKEQGKIMMSIEDALKYKSGMLGINLIRGKATARSCFVQVLIDDRVFADFTSRKSNNRIFTSHAGEAFIRDLPNSIITFRLTKTKKVKSKDQVLASTEPMSVMELIEKGYDEVFKVDLEGSTVEFMFEYVPAEISMSAHDSITDTGLMNIKIIKGIDLPAADRNGYSDPFIVLKANDQELFRTKTIKKTLNPEFNETTQVVIKSRERTKFELIVYDWDMAGKNDLLGTIPFNLEEMEIEKTQVWKLPLDSKAGGYVEFETSFSPGYIRPGFGVVTRETLGRLGSLASLGGGVVGGAVEGVGVVGGVVGGAVGGVGHVGGALATGGVGAAADGVNHVGGALTGAAGGLLKGINKHAHQPNFHPLPPHMAHHKNGSIGGSQSVRSSIDIQSVRSEAFHGQGVIHGRLTIAKLITGKSTSGSFTIKAEVVSPGNKHKSIHKTRASKVQSGEIRWEEQCALKCDPQCTLLLEVREHHVLGKDKVIATANFNLSDAVGVRDDIPVKTSVGDLILNFHYGS